jgi:hypothetical protein
VKKLVVISLATLACVACGKGRNNNPIAAAKAAGAERDLLGAWQSECNTKMLQGVLDWAKVAVKEGADAAKQAAPGSQRIEYKFEVGTVTRKVVLYNGTQCAGELIRFEEVGKYKVETDPNKKSQDGGKRIDFHFDQVKATAVGQNGVTLANSVKLCDKSDWSADQTVNVNEHSSESTCYGIPAPRDVFNLERVDANTLYLALDQPKGNLENQRPTKVLDPVNKKEAVEGGIKLSKH